MADVTQHRLEEAVAEIPASEVVSSVFGPLPAVKLEIYPVPDPRVVSVALDGSQQVLQGQLRGLLNRAGVTSLQATEASPVVANLLLGPVAEAAQKAAVTLDFAGIVFGALTADHLLVATCVKDLLRNETHEMVAEQITGALDRLLTGKKEAAGTAPPSPSPRLGSPPSSVSSADRDDLARPFRSSVGILHSTRTSQAPGVSI